MADLALGVPNWLSKDYDKEYMENYRLTIARKILNFDGAQCLAITQFDKQSRDFYIRKEVSKTTKSNLSRTTADSSQKEENTVAIGEDDDTEGDGIDAGEKINDAEADDIDGEEENNDTGADDIDAEEENNDAGADAIDAEEENNDAGGDDIDAEGDDSDLEEDDSVPEEDDSDSEEDDFDAKEDDNNKKTKRKRIIVGR